MCNYQPCFLNYNREYFHSWSKYVRYYNPLYFVNISKCFSAVTNLELEICNSKCQIINLHDFSTLYGNLIPNSYQTDTLQVNYHQLENVHWKRRVCCKSRYKSSRIAATTFVLPIFVFGHFSRAILNTGYHRPFRAQQCACQRANAENEISWPDPTGRFSS